MTPHVMIKKTEQVFADNLFKSLKALGFVNTKESGDWLLYSLRYMNCLVKCWVNKQEECSIQIEVIE
jgi:hypothetical protein